MEHRAWSFPLRMVALDVVLALFITVMQVQGTVARVAAEGAPRPLTDFANLGFALLVVSGLVVAGRRLWPVPVFVTTALASLVYYGLDFPDGPGWIGLFVALCTVTAYGDGRRSLVIAGVGTAVLATGWLFAAADSVPGRGAIGWVFFRIGASVMSAAIGESIRSRRVIAAEAQERAERAERTREEEARARVDAERLRIVREVHDTVAHAIAIINVQSGVTVHVLDKRPEQAREALRAIEQTSSRALQEMRAILGVLRDDNDGRDGNNGRGPHPGLGQIDDLTAQARDAGLDVTLEATSPAAPLPSAVGSAAYRILQESITNVIRHAGPTRVTVALNPGVDALEIRVTDEGRRAAPGDDPVDPRLPTQHPGGNGTGVSAKPGRAIRGMRERCRLLGGDLDAKPTPGGGFEVTARLPFAPTGPRL